MLASLAMIFALLMGLFFTKYLLLGPAKQKRSLLTLTLLATFILGGCSAPTGPGSEPIGEGQLEVHFIDVGQGDSILIKNGQQAMLIDTGTRNNCVRLKRYLDKQGVKKYEYLIGTNPSKDHIGGMSELLGNYEFNWMILPQIEGLNQTYKDLQMKLLARYVKPILAQPGQSYPLGDACFTLLAPNNSAYEDLVDYSIVIKLEYGETSFLLCSDAGETSEQEMMDMEFDLAANLIKLGRHGSSSSSSDQFLQAVNPDYAVISVGKDNPYGHPHMATMLKLKENNIPVYRTDEQGTLVVKSDGKNISFEVEPGTYTWPEMTLSEAAAEGQEEVLTPENLPEKVWINEDSNKYHRADCRFLEERRVDISEEEAQERGYEPCQLCQP